MAKHYNNVDVTATLIHQYNLNIFFCEESKTSKVHDDVGGWYLTSS